MGKITKIFDTRHLSIPLPDDGDKGVTLQGKVAPEHMNDLSRLWSSRETVFYNQSQWTRSASSLLYTRVITGIESGEFKDAVARNERFLEDMEALGNRLDYKRFTVAAEKAVLGLWACYNYDGAADKLTRAVVEAHSYDPFFGRQIEAWVRDHDAFQEVRAYAKKRKV